MTTKTYYTSGQFARMANVTIRTVRYYDKQNILKPSYVSPSGARFYTDEDFARLQQIVLLKYLGFSLQDIREMTIHDTDYSYMLRSLVMQKRLVEDRIAQMQLVNQAIGETMEEMKAQKKLDWSHMLELIHLTGMEQSLKKQYQDATNVQARIRLHSQYSRNPQGWFPWIYEQCRVEDGMRILELGCGNGALWQENREQLPENIEIVLSDISQGMVRDAERNLGEKDVRFSFRVFDCQKIPFPDRSFDRVIANHLLFYCEDIPAVCREAERVLKPDGMFLCSTYGKNHMKEISSLVQKFDSRIRLSGESLYEKFGLENGKAVLKTVFPDVELRNYEDAIELDEAEPLISYILSCHGNQNQYLLDRYQEFREYVERQVAGTFHITKDAGIFLCKK